MVGEASDLLDTRPLGEDENSGTMADSSKINGHHIWALTNSIIPPQGYYYGNRLRYMAIAVNTTLPYGNVGYKQGLPIMENWEEYFNQEVCCHPCNLVPGYLELHVQLSKSCNSHALRDLNEFK